MHAGANYVLYCHLYSSHGGQQQQATGFGRGKPRWKPLPVYTVALLHRMLGTLLACMSSFQRAYARHVALSHRWMDESSMDG